MLAPCFRFSILRSLPPFLSFRSLMSCACASCCCCAFSLSLSLCTNACAGAERPRAHTLLPNALIASGILWCMIHALVLALAFAVAPTEAQSGVERERQRRMDCDIRNRWDNPADGSSSIRTARLSDDCCFLIHADSLSFAVFPASHSQ